MRIGRRAEVLEQRHVRTGEKRRGHGEHLYWHCREQRAWRPVPVRARGVHAREIAQLTAGARGAGLAAFDLAAATLGTGVMGLGVVATALGDGGGVRGERCWGGEGIHCVE